MDDGKRRVAVIGVLGGSKIRGRSLRGGRAVARFEGSRGSVDDGKRRMAVLEVLGGSKIRGGV